MFYKLFTITVVFVITSPAFAGGIGSQVPPLIKPGVPDYTAGAAQAVATGRPLVVFLGCPARSVAGCEIAVAKTLVGYDAPAVVVAVPGEGWLHWRATLRAGATDEQIRAAVAPKAVSQPAGPFQRIRDRRQSRLAGRDADLPAEVSAIVGEMEPYETARLTQVSGNRSGRGANYAVSRSSVGEKWVVPGGLEGLTGWTNQLYRAKDNRVRNWFDRADPSETYHVTTGELWGSEFVHKREYGVGAKFADVLATDKGIFEVRLAEKVKEGWFRSVPYRNPVAAPEGYVRVATSKCAECHQKAGDGAYGSGRIPGGGGVISEPLAGVE